MRRGLGAYLLLFAGAALGAAPAARDAAAHFEFREFTRGGVHYHYAVWLPADYREKHGWPAMLSLHGSGESGLDGRKPTLVGLGRALTAHPEAWPFVVVFPQKPREDEEWWEEEAAVFETIQRARREFDFDSERMALCGMSQGGHGVWMLGARYPNRWACLVPIAGYGRVRTVAKRVARLPVWAFHGLRDDLVNPEDTRQIVEAIRAERERLDLGSVETRVTLYPEANHNSWDSAFAEPTLPAWILQRIQSR
jgi:predicted peptidase